jgi:hypothetical protein
MISFLDMLSPTRKKHALEQIEESKRLNTEYQEALRVTQELRTNYLSQLCWDWFKDNKTEDVFKSGDKVLINTLKKSEIPLRRDLFIYPEEGMIITRALPCYELIFEKCKEDRQDSVVRRAKKWITEEYFHIMAKEDFDANVSHFYLRYGVKVFNPMIKNHFNDGVAVVPQDYLVNCDSEFGTMLHSIGLMERHITKEQDTLVKMYDAIESFMRSKDESGRGKEDVEAS